MASIFLHLLVLPLLTVAQDASPAKQGYNGGEDNPQDPSDAGAEGASKGAFSLSRGAIAAIITVAVIVAVGGAISAILFWLAKKRQWDVRNSIRRASRRFVGRTANDTSTKRHNRRTGVRLNSPPPSRAARKERDLEKAIPAGGKGTTTTIISGQQSAQAKE